MTATLVLVLLGLLVAPIGAQMNDLDINDLKTIKNQLNVLMEKRQQDYEQMEKSLFQSLRRNLDLVALKEEIKILSLTKKMLLKNIKKSKSDVEKLYHTFELVRCYMHLGVDYFKECRSMAKQCLELSENINSHTWTVNSLVWLALAECRLGNKLECYRKINVAFNISKQLKEPGVTLFLEKMRSVISDLDVARLNQNEKRKAEIVNFMPNLETKMKAMYMFRQLDTLPEDRQMSLVPGISLSGVNSKYTSSKAAHKSEQLKISQSSDGGDRDKVAVGWLKDVIESLKSEIQDVWSAINETAQIHKATTLQNDIQALKKDLDGNRKDLQTMQGELLSVRKNVENAAILQIELEKKLNSLIKYQNTVNKKNEELEEKQMATIYKRVAISNEDPLQTNVITTIVTDREIKELEILESSRKSLNHRMARLEKRIKGILYRESSIVERENRLSRLEVNLNATKEAIAFNLTRQDATLDRLHGSLLELLESVETLDDRVDACLPEVRKEISKIEFAVARINASVAIIKEDQNNQMLTTKALGEGMSAIQRTLSKTSEKIFIPDKITKDSHQKYTSALNELDSLHKPYGRIIGELPKDCSQINENGEYLISSNGKAILVHCEISKNMSWITFQRRTNDQLKFNNLWTEYSEGFGQVYGDLWLGNEAIHQLTSDNKSSLQINMIDIYGNFWIAEYKNFKVSNASTGYLLSVSGFKGNATDALSFQNGHKFSTLDHDQDDSTTNCAANYEGGWWYSRCQHANLNGKYNYGLTWFDSSRNQYIAISKSEMKIGRPIV